MNKKVLIFPIIVVGMAIWLVKSDSGNQPEIKAAETVAQIQEEQSKTQQSLAAQTKSFGAVTVEAEPIQVVVGEPVIIKLALNTHSVDLSYDYTKIATLEDDLGNGYQATEWTGGSGGHHLQGQLVFENLKPGVKSLTLELQVVDNESNSFVWRR